MEEMTTKEGGEKKGPCGEFHCMNMHRFCGKGFCLLRVLFAIILVYIAFALGVCVGQYKGERYDRKYNDGWYGGYGHMMIWNDDGYGRGWDNRQNDVYYYGGPMMGGGRYFEGRVTVPVAPAGQTSTQTPQ